MNNSMVAHLWANEKKESARGSNLFFEGRSIYSYGYHFEVGRIVRNKCGEKAYLLNDKYYSSSTCKHQHCVRSAIPTGSKVFSVGYNMSDDDSMAFITSQLELDKCDRCSGCAFENYIYDCVKSGCLGCEREDGESVRYTIVNT